MSHSGIQHPVATMSLTDYIKAAPKAELHVHLEGTIQPETLLTLAERNRVELPCQSLEELREWFRFSDFHHFIEVYVAITRSMLTVDDFELIVHEYGAEMARQNIRYAEVTFSPSNHKWLNDVSEEVFFTGITNGREAVKKEFGVEINWVFDLVRNGYPNKEKMDYVTQVAIDGMQDGVVAIGLGGLEPGFPPEPFKPWFDRALAAGLHSTPHAGELGGPESIWGAIRALKAERIGHGVRAIEDSGLVAYLAEHRIPIEVNPTSNICLGVFDSIENHPLRRLHDAGVVVIVNSDDPTLFNTTLNDETTLLHTAFGFPLEAIDSVLLNGVRYSFLSAEQKQVLEDSFLGEMADLKEGTNVVQSSQLPAK